MSTITLEINEKEYTLEYNRRALVKMEEKGFSVKDTENKIFTSLEYLFWGALIKNHPYINRQSANALLDVVLEEYDILNVLESLQSLMNDVLDIDIPNEDEENEDETKPKREKKKMSIVK